MNIITEGKIEIDQKSKLGKEELNKQIKWVQTHKVIDGQDFKLCKACKLYHPATVEFFYRNKGNKMDGLHSKCKKCAIKESVENQKKNRDKYYLQHKKYRQSEKYKAWSQKHGEWQRSSGYQLEYQRANSDKFSYYSSLHRDHDITDSEWEHCLHFFGFKCAYCGLTQDDSVENFNQRLHKDHVQHNGYNDLRNAVPACKRCNSSKHQTEMKEWFNKQLFYSNERYNLIHSWINDEYLKYIEEKLPYKIIKTKKKNEFGLYEVDKYRNIGKVIAIRKTRKEIIKRMDELIKENQPN